MSVKTDNCSPISKLMIDRKDLSDFEVIRLCAKDYFDDMGKGYNGNWFITETDNGAKLHLQRASPDDWYRAISDGLAHWFHVQTVDKEVTTDWRDDKNGEILTLELP